MRISCIHPILLWTQLIHCIPYCFYVNSNITKLKTTGFFFLFFSTSLLHSSNGTVFTPNWPLKYPPDASCLWSLSLRSKAVRFFFSAFDLEINFICKTDAGLLPTDDISISGEWWQKLTIVSYKLHFFSRKKLSWKHRCSLFASIFDNFFLQFCHNCVHFDGYNKAMKKAFIAKLCRLIQGFNCHCFTWLCSEENLLLNWCVAVFEGFCLLSLFLFCHCILDLQTKINRRQKILKKKRKAYKMEEKPGQTQSLAQGPSYHHKCKMDVTQIQSMRLLSMVWEGVEKLWTLIKKKENWLIFVQHMERWEEFACLVLILGVSLVLSCEYK